MKKIVFVFAFLLTVSFQLNAQWVQINNGLPNTNVKVLAASNNQLFAGMGDNNGIYISSDNGTYWVASNSGLNNYDIKSFAVSGQNIFTGTAAGVYLSTDNGTNWSFASNGYMGASVPCMAASGNNVYAVTGGKVYRTTNNGSIWYESTVVSSEILAFCTMGSNLFAGFLGGYIFRSNDNGTSWIPVHIAHIGEYVGLTSFGVVEQNLFVGARYGGSVFRTTNNGSTWERCESGLPNFIPIYTFAVYETNLFAGTNDGVFLSTDYGSSWTAVNTGIRNVDIRTLTIQDTNLYAGTSDSGIWRRQLNEMVTNIDEELLPDTEFELLQNYPNPFNPSTKISWQSPVDSWQTLKVYDILGNVVATLVNEYRNAGNYEIEFNPASSTRALASGIYFYRLQAGSFVETKKMILLK